MERVELGGNSLQMNASFGASANRGAAIAADNQNGIISSHGEFETFEMEPWKRTLSIQIYELIKYGQHGKAMDLISAHMDGFSETHKTETLEVLERVLEALENNGYDYQVQAFISLLYDSELGMDIEFHNTGPNSPGDTEDTGEISRLKHRIEAHYDAHRHYLPQNIPQFLGVSVGPR